MQQSCTHQHAACNRTIHVSMQYAINVCIDRCHKLTSPGSHSRGRAFTACILTAGTLSSQRSSIVSCMLSSKSESSSSAVRPLKMTCTSWQHLVRTDLSLAVTRLIRSLSSFSAKESHSASLSGSLSAIKLLMKRSMRSPLVSPYTVMMVPVVWLWPASLVITQLLVLLITCGMSRTCCMHVNMWCRHRSLSRCSSCHSTSAHFLCAARCF